MLYSLIEKWKKITGYPYYEVSSLGNIRSSITSRTKAIKPQHHPKGYLIVAMKSDVGEKAKSMTVHRIVAKHFIPNPYNKPTVNHDDGNKRNNRSSNLVWNTHSENSKHAFKNGLLGGFAKNPLS